MIRTNRRFLTNVIKSSTGSVKNHIAGEETFAYQPKRVGESRRSIITKLYHSSATYQEKHLRA